MHSHQNLINTIIARYRDRSSDSNLIHATMASEPGRIEMLRKSVRSLLAQVDILHVYLNNYSSIPRFLNHEKIYITSSQDFGNLGECGKYYWVGDFGAYHFICSDTIIYPQNYIKVLKQKVDDNDRQTTIGAGGYKIVKPFTNFDQSVIQISEFQETHNDKPVDVLKDSCLVFHTSSLAVSRHHFYQPALSSIWFSILALEQNTPLICAEHAEAWIQPAGHLEEPLSDKHDPKNYRSFLTGAYFSDVPAKHDCETINSCFDKIYVMNLDRRPDRLENVKSRLEAHNINASRFPAIDGYAEPYKSQYESYNNSSLQHLPDGVEPVKTFKEKYLGYQHYITRIHFMENYLKKKAVQSPGALGYALTYVSILNKAIQNNYQRILIFDDDVIFHKNFNHEFRLRMRMLPDDWKLIMLGAMQHHWDDSWITWVNKNLYHCQGTSIASHAVAMQAKAFLPLLYYSEKLDLPIDEGAVYHIQHVYAKQCYVFYPNLVIQDVGESEINSSVLTAEQIQDKNNLFRWDYQYYEFHRFY